MTLHVAIEKLLKSRGTSMTTSEIAMELNKNKWYQKKDGSELIAYQIHGRTKNYPNLFDREGSLVLLSNGILSERKKISKKERILKPKTEKKQTDENYVLDLCDNVLNLKSSRQHKFYFLIGDMNSREFCAKLPVDAYYEQLNLVIEYREKQHTESVNFFDKPNKLTVSGVHRGEQRKIYDQRRDEVLPKNGIKLIKISYSDFNYNGQKRIIRNEQTDFKIITELIKNGRQQRI